MTLKSEDAVAIASTARRLGVDPRTLGALFELESGTDPNIWGGSGGQYRGLIQFGPGARKEVGLPSGPMTISEQLPYVEKYFQQRGFQPGRHGPTELYRTVLVGNPGQSGTDSFGTNSDSAAKRMMPGGDLYQRFSSKFNSALGDSAAAIGQIPATTRLADTTMPVKRAADPLIAAVGAMVEQGLNASGGPTTPMAMPTTPMAMSEQAQIAVIEALLPRESQVSSGGGAVATAATPGAGLGSNLAYIQGGQGPGGPNTYGPHFDIKGINGQYFDRAALDDYVRVNGKPLSGGLTVPGGEFGASRDGGARKHAGWDYAFGDNAALTLTGGAQWTGSQSTDYGDAAQFRLPDGRTFKILHGKLSRA